jgi:hypothetical protein
MAKEKGIQLSSLESLEVAESLALCSSEYRYTHIAIMASLRFMVQ